MTEHPTTEHPTDAGTAERLAGDRGGAAGVRLEHVTKRFRGGVTAIDDVTLDVEPGEFVVLVGPSGCGKSTLLRAVAGLDEVSAGRVHIGGRDVTTELPQRRDVAMVFQSYALYPRMTVRRNLGFGLRMRHVPRPERDRRVDEVAQVLGLDELLDRRPAALSGGQRQRVAMGRALVREPQVFLMDEPLSNLDARLRVTMRAQLSLLHERLGITTLYVTHDQTEAMTLGQRVAVLRDGALQQCDTPTRLYRHPVNLFVAAFIGSPSMNLVHARVERGAVSFAGVTIPLPAGPPPAGVDGEVILGMRPTALTFVGDGGGDGRPVIDAVPELVEELGDERHVIFDVDAPPVDTDATRAAIDAQPDATALLPEGKARFTAQVPADVPAARGRSLRLAIDPERLYLFDPATNLALTS